MREINYFALPIMIAEEIPKPTKKDFVPRWKELDMLEKRKSKQVQVGIKSLREFDCLGIALLQRKFEIGYSRAAKLLDALIENGFVDTVVVDKKRKIVETKRSEMEGFIKEWFQNMSSRFYFPQEQGYFDVSDLSKKIKGYCIHRFGESEKDWVYEYADYVFEIIDYVTCGQALLECREKAKEFLSKQIDELSMEDIKYYFRWVDMLEKTVPGNIARELQNSRFRNMFERYLKLQIENLEIIEDI